MRSLLLLVIPLALQAQTNVLMNRYDQFSDGANIHEVELKQTNVAAHFSKLFSYYVDGAVYAQPLYVHGVDVPGAGAKIVHFVASTSSNDVHAFDVFPKSSPKNVLYVATMNDKVYAFNASQSGPPLWMRDLSDESAGITPVPVSDITNSNDLNVVGNAGIEGTPVIDLASQSIYFVARTKENGRYLQRLHKLDIRDGQDQVPPTVIEAHDGSAVFDPKLGNQRPALALVNGSVIVAWASHEDIGPYHGWIMAYDEASLKQSGVLCITPDGENGGIWQSGRGPAVDESGALYFETGNGSWDGKHQFGNSVIKVRADKTHLWVDDDYTPHDFARQNETDADLGSSGPLLVPNKGILICGNKQGELFLLNPSHLGGLTEDDSGLLQMVNLKSGRVLAGPSYWNGPMGAELFIWNEAGALEMLSFAGKLLEPSNIAKAAIASHGSPGGALTVSSDGAKPGTGIVWATVGKNKSADHGNADGVLHAFNAETLQELWNSEANAARDRLGTLVKFVPPLVEDGKVYVPNYDNAVNVYGMMPN